MFQHDVARIDTRLALLFLAIAVMLGGGKPALGAGVSDPLTASERLFATNTAQIRELSPTDFLDGCDFHLTGVLTLVDTGRNLIVLQDASGAVAVNFPLSAHKLKVGQLITVDGTNCCPYFSRFPDYPFHPSGSEIRSSFEGPVGAGEYYLARMRGWLRPPVTGKYSFWIASDNSSELWLSSDANPSNIRRIGLIPRFTWVEPHDWSRLPSQHSDLIELKTGEIYYIEAIHEQTTGLDNLSVAWQGPTINQSVIDGSYLIPWNDGRAPGANTGILREYWTNFSVGGLIGMGGPRAFTSALTLKEAAISVIGSGQMPTPVPIALSQPWLPEDNFRFVTVEGAVKFLAEDMDSALLEISDGQNSAQVRAPLPTPDTFRSLTNAVVRVEGVCEGVFDSKGALTPGLIWAASSDNISVIQTNPTNTAQWVLNQPAQATLSKNPAMEGFFATRGVVTFNDRVLGTDYLFVQEGAAALRVTIKDGPFKDQFGLGRWMEIGGALEPGKNIGTITPQNVSQMGWHSMPIPIDQPLVAPIPGNRDGRWNELQGIVRSANSNGTLTLLANSGAVNLWIGNTPSNQLARYIDAKVRVRGVLSLEILDTPVLLIPSPSFVDVEEPQPQDLFAVPLRRAADIKFEAVDVLRAHRVRVAGEVTWCDSQSFFLQDPTGGIRIRNSQLSIVPGERLEVLAFPLSGASGRILADPVVRVAASAEGVKPQRLDLSKELSTAQSGKLVFATGTLLSRKTNGESVQLEFQAQQRVFVAALGLGSGALPEITPGSFVRVTGVCVNEAFSSPVNILLRGPADVAVVKGPPWWTWKRAAMLVGSLLAVVFGAFSWVYLLRRRLEKQQAAQLAFSRHVFERVEEERRRIAANLHDSLGQVLLAIKNQTLMAMQLKPNEQGLHDRLKEISTTTSQAIDEVRQITHGLRPYQLDRLGLTQAIRTSADRAAENSSIEFATRVEEIDGLFDKEAEIHVYRIVQEAVNNVVKHSGATEATVVIKQRGAVVTLSIRDNGRGYDPAKLSSESHDVGYGLSGMAERVRILGGTMTIDSQPGQGACLNVDVPFTKASV